jgi:hypothetical protein
MACATSAARRWGSCIRTIYRQRYCRWRWADAGFAPGLVSSTMWRTGAPGSLGDFGWANAAKTYYCVDPLERRPSATAIAGQPVAGPRSFPLSWGTGSRGPLAHRIECSTLNGSWPTGRTVAFGVESGNSREVALVERGF